MPPRLFLWPLLLALGCSRGGNPPLSDAGTAMPNLLVIAHRGASGYAPEHTFASWDMALAMGADYLEQDLQLTRDGMLVVLHDESLDRTARREGKPCRGRVIDHTLAELQQCEVGSWFNAERPELARPEFAAQRIATLAQVLERYGERGSFYIETKQPEEAPGMEEALLALLDQHGLREPASREWRVLIQSFSETSLRKIRGEDARLPLIRLIEKGATARGIEARLGEIAEYAVGIGPHFSDVDARLVAAAHARCLVVHPYTVNAPADRERMLAAGVDGMFTDYPDSLLVRRPPEEARGRTATAAAAAAWAKCHDRLPASGSPGT